MKTSLLFFPLAALSLLPVRPARADFNPALVADDSRWVVYVDVNALRSCAVGKQVMAAANQFQLDGNVSPIHLDVPKVLATIGSVTLYGANFAKEPKRIDGTLVIQGTPDLRKIAEALLIQANLAKPEAVTEVKDLGYPAYAFSPPAGKSGPQVVMAFPPEPIVIVSKSEDQVRRARAVFRGEGRTLAQNSASPLTAFLPDSSHALLFVASVIPSDELFQEQSPQARVLQMTHAVSVALADDGAKTSARVRMVAASDEMADKLQKILQGMAAMMSLAESSDPQVNEFLNSTTVGRENDSVTLQLSYGSQRLADMLARMIETHPPGHPSAPPRSLGHVLASWTIDAPAEGAAPEAAWRQVPTVSLANGSKILLRAEGPRGSVNFDRVRIEPSDAPEGTPAPWTYSRQSMTEVHRPMVPLANGQLQRTFELWFPGEAGSYRIEVHVTPQSAGGSQLSVGLENPPSPHPDAPVEHAPVPANDRQP